MNRLLALSIILLTASQVSAFKFEKLGDKSVYISNLQNFLIERNYLKTKQSTGYFGKLTEKALKEYQYDRGLKVTGVLDWDTMNTYKTENLE